MKRLRRPLATLLILGLATAARAFDTTPVSDPEALGFSSSRLARIAASQQAQIDALQQQIRDMQQQPQPVGETVANGSPVTEAPRTQQPS